MTTVKEVWDFLVKVQDEIEQKKHTNKDILEIIGLLKIAQTGYMLRMESKDYPFYDSDSK